MADNITSRNISVFRYVTESDYVTLRYNKEKKTNFD